MKQLALVALAITFSAGAAVAEEVSKPNVTRAPLSQPLSPISGLEITTGKNGGLIAFRRGWDISRGGNFDTISIGMSAPFETSGNGGLPSSLDALASSATIEARFSRFHFPTRSPDSNTAERKLCDEVRKSLNEADAAAMGNSCFSGVISQYAPDRLLEFQDLPYGGKPPLFRIWGVSGKSGSDTFKFVDSTTFAEQSVERSGWSLSAFYALHRARNPWLVTAKYEHQEGYESKKETTLCPAGGGACVTGPAGPPDAVAKDIVSIDYRYSDNDFTASATLLYDVDMQVYALEIPIYLTRGADGSFNGGVKLNWRSDTSETMAAVFVGSAFTIGMPD